MLRSTSGVTFFIQFQIVEVFVCVVPIYIKSARWSVVRYPVMLIRRRFAVVVVVVVVVVSF